MKNVLTHKNGSTILLANVDDNTNRLFINDEEIPSTSWVGSGTYTKVIDGITISITKISDLSGNIQLKKVTETSFKFVRKIAAVQFSHIGQIIESTTLDTLAKVQEIYGSDTTWIQHSGYMLRGAASGVVANSAAKTGGADTHTLTAAQTPAHTHGEKSLTGQFGGNNAGTEWRLQSGHSVGFTQASGIASRVASASQTVYNNYLSNIPGSETIYKHIKINATHTHTSVGSGGAHNNVPNYKSVYIWERTA